MITFYANKMTSFSIWIPFIYFAYHIVLAKTCNTVLIRSGGIEYLCPFPHLRRVAFGLTSSSMKLAVGFL